MAKICSLSTILIAMALNLMVASSASHLEARQIEPLAAAIASPGDAPDSVKFSNSTRSLLPGIGAVLNGYFGSELNEVHQLREGICEPLLSSSGEWSYKKDTSKRGEQHLGSHSRSTKAARPSATARGAGCFFQTDAQSIASKRRTGALCWFER
ncbi:hypothetical protein B0T25DRAFT_515960 [Lasiosphaeria hispida]|uniref:Uncharacterized protein n=1 Tax=Lasiosphaeria hispida TaxID=260671 RepID=A0AAJ0HT79_9PEZI|nr:hypothetical protein B0T25DRAFT_515960 [Lasiosphaeria hispida]